MKNLIEGHEATVVRLAESLKKAASRSAYQRIAGVLIRATRDRSAAEIAPWLGWSTATVHVLPSRWAKEGEATFDVRRRGGRHHRHLTPEQKARLPAPFVERAEAGGMRRVAEIQQACRERTGKAVARSTVHRLLERYGGCKIVPRPTHPKADVAALVDAARTASPTMCSPTSTQSRMC